MNWSFFSSKKNWIVIFHGKNGTFSFCARDKFVSTKKLVPRVLQTTLTELMVRESLREVRVRERSKSDFSEMHWLGSLWARNAYRFLLIQFALEFHSILWRKKGLLWPERQVRIIEVALCSGWLLSSKVRVEWSLFVVLFRSFVLAVVLVHWRRMLLIGILKYISFLGKRLSVRGRQKDLVYRLVQNGLHLLIPYSLSGALPYGQC